MSPVISATTNKRRPTSSRHQARKLLAEAFASFTQAADSLERSYGQLQSEVVRLQNELARTNTELQHSLEENVRVRRYLWHILEHLPCGVLVISAHQLRLANPAARTLLALDEQRETDGATLPEAVRHLLTQAENGQGEALSEQGRRILAVALSRPTDSADPDERILILRDITLEKRLEEEREAHRRLQALAEMATLLAHEVRNPLGSLELFAGLIADATRALPDVRSWVEQLQVGLRCLAATVNNVLHFHTQPAPPTTTVALDRLLRETIEFLRPLARQRQIQISFVNRIGAVSLVADAHRLQQAILNLALNAFRAMAPGGTFWLRLDWAATDSPRTVQLEVEDTGCGIPPEHLERIFEPGFTTDRSSAGLGLTVVRQVVEQHRGAITVRSRPGRGTIFTLQFPAEGTSA